MSVKQTLHLLVAQIALKLRYGQTRFIQDQQQLLTQYWSTSL